MSERTTAAAAAEVQIPAELAQHPALKECPAVLMALLEQDMAYALSQGLDQGEYLEGLVEYLDNVPEGTVVAVASYLAESLDAGRGRQAGHAAGGTA